MNSSASTNLTPESRAGPFEHRYPEDGHGSEAVLRQPLPADNDYALAWVRNYGRGRTFYCTIAHNPSVFWDPKMLEFYLGAVQFALGDLPAPTIPSAKVTAGHPGAGKAGLALGHRSLHVPQVHAVRSDRENGPARPAVHGRAQLSKGQQGNSEGF